MIRTEAAAPPDFSESELFESALEFHHGQQYGIDANARVKDNLRKEAEARGIDPARLVFAPRTWLAQHLARHRQADLFLDTLPYNAHTTTSDALWAGLPVVTVLGETFAGRVAASLLNAVGLPSSLNPSKTMKLWRSNWRARPACLPKSAASSTLTG